MEGELKDWRLRTVIFNYGKKTNTYIKHELYFLILKSFSVLILVNIKMENLYW